MKIIPTPVHNAIRSAAVRALLAWERMESGVCYDPFSRATRAYPYDLYEELRAKDPVHRLRTIDAWLLTEYEHVDRVLRDHSRFIRGERNEAEAIVSLLDLDPPDHTRIRGLVSMAFTRRAVAELEPRIQKIADDLLDDTDGSDRFDLVSAFAAPMPIIVIAEMLGVPPEDRDRFGDWSNDVALSVEPVVTDERQRIISAASEKLIDYFESIIELRRREPRDDLISALIAAEDEGDKLTHEELLGTLMLLLVAGNETTRNLISSGLLALIRHPEQLRRLRDEPSVIDSAINEMLRYDSPVQLDGRVAKEDVEIGGKRIRAGQRVISVLGAANRDPSVFTAPQALDVARRERSHLSFGRGIHHCLGAPLAALEGRIAFASLLERFSSFRLLEEPEYRDQLVLRGVEELWVEVERAEPSGAAAGDRLSAAAR